MADLLSFSEKAQIEEGHLDVMDTLHQSDVSIFVQLLSLDIRQVSTNNSYTKYDLKTLVKEERKDNKEDLKGSEDINNISFKFHIEHLVSLGLINGSGELQFNSSDSYCIWRGRKYNIKSLAVEKIVVRINAQVDPVER